MATTQRSTTAPAAAGHEPLRCGFLFNHDQLHQLAHSAPIALELMRMTAKLRVALIATTRAQHDALRRMLADNGLPADDLHLIGLPRGLRAAAAILDRALPFSRVGTLLANRALFGSLSLLVVPEKTSLLLRSHCGLTSLRFVHTRHGAGDRAVGFDRHSGEFDLVLMSGPKIRDRLRDAGLLAATSHAIIGYPKFDAYPAGARRLFANDRPTVLYNPHSSPRLSSWYRHGAAVLEAFYRSGRYNLIFAPHVMLFDKALQISTRPLRLALPGTIARRYRDCPHMLIDLGSERSNDMTYTEAADLYLGDASSQVYEFLRRPRPCAFIDAHATRWRGDPNYAHWAGGPVLHDADTIVSDVASAFDRHAEFAAVQRSLFAYSIDLQREPSARRGAEAILDFACGASARRPPAPPAATARPREPAVEQSP